MTCPRCHSTPASYDDEDRHGDAIVTVTCCGLEASGYTVGDALASFAQKARRVEERDALLAIVVGRIVRSLDHRSVVFCAKCARIRLWSELTPIGVMHCGGVCPDLEQANCRCGSTLGREVRAERRAA